MGLIYTFPKKNLTKTSGGGTPSYRLGCTESAGIYIFSLTNIYETLMLDLQGSLSTFHPPRNDYDYLQLLAKTKKSPEFVSEQPFVFIRIGTFRKSVDYLFK